MQLFMLQISKKCHYFEKLKLKMISKQIIGYE
jgi:hypothetical protein